MNPQLTEEQERALQDYKSTHGRYWKHNLKRDWLTGKDASRPNGHLLRQVRNQFGPKWLEGYEDDQT